MSKPKEKNHVKNLKLFFFPTWSEIHHFYKIIRQKKNYRFPE